MNKARLEKQSRNQKIVHLSPVPSKDRPMSRLARRYGELERTELLPEIVSYLLYGLLALLLIGVLWAALASVDIVAVAPARLVPIEQVKVIQPEVDGVVDQILVTEGQKVAPGTVLAVLEKSKPMAEVQKRDAEFLVATQDAKSMELVKASLEESIANPGLPPLNSIDIDGSARTIADLNHAYVQLREAELDSKSVQGSTISESGALGVQSSSLSEQKQLHRAAQTARSAERVAKKNQKVLELEQLKKNLESAKVELSQAEVILNATVQQEESFRGVFQAGAVSRVDYLNIVKEVERAKRDVTKQTATIEELNKKIGIAENQLRELNSNDAASDLEKKAQISNFDFEIGKLGVLSRSLERRRSLALAAYESALSRAKAALSRIGFALDAKKQKLKEAEAQVKIAGHDFIATNVTSPVAGTVTGIRLRGKGHVIRRGDRLMSVVPEGAKLVFEASLPNKDSGFVERNQDVKIKLAAYPFEDFGVINGKVVHIEATAESAQNRSSVFIARVMPEHQYITVHGQKRPLMSGMAATCEIITRKRSLLDILFEPLKRMKETRWQ